MGPPTSPPHTPLFMPTPPCLTPPLASPPPRSKLRQRQLQWLQRKEVGQVLRAHAPLMHAQASFGTSTRTRSTGIFAHSGIGHTHKHTKHKHACTLRHCTHAQAHLGTSTLAHTGNEHTHKHPLAQAHLAQAHLRTQALNTRTSTL